MVQLMVDHSSVQKEQTIFNPIRFPYIVKCTSFLLRFGNKNNINNRNRNRKDLSHTEHRHLSRAGKGVGHLDHV